MSETDFELLTRYRERHAEDAFAELVRRHVDLVFSAALRQVRSPQLAEEVAQSAFLDLARQAGRLAPDSIVSAWLYQVTRRTAIDVVRREARRQARERVAMELAAMEATPTPTDWTQIEPLLDEAMEALEATDRSAVLLRFFENKSLHEVAEALGTSEEAARKRVSRAVERLRGAFLKRGVAAGAGALAVAISANAVQAAPAGLSAGIISATIAGTTFTTTATATITKAIAMTTLQKTVITAALAAAIGAGIYEAHQNSRLREQNQALQQQQAPLTEQIARLERQRAEASNELAEAKAQVPRGSSGPDTSEVLKLRGKVGVLQQRLSASEAQDNTSGSMAKMLNDPVMKEYLQKAMLDKFRTMYEPLFQELKLNPEQVDQVLRLMGERATKSLAALTAPAGGADQAAARDAAQADQQVASQLKELLGDAGCARLNDFNDEIPARTTLGLLKTQLGDNQLNDQQTARLLQIIKAEPHELTQGIVGAPDRAFMMGSQADIDAFLQQVAESNQRILQQAGSFLNPDQLTGLNTVLTNAIQARKIQGAAFKPKS